MPYCAELEASFWDIKWFIYAAQIQLFSEGKNAFCIVCVPPSLLIQVEWDVRHLSDAKTDSLLFSKLLWAWLGLVSVKKRWRSEARGMLRF